MKKTRRILLVVVSLILILWLALTIWAEKTGTEKAMLVGTEGNKGTALIVYDPDPFYNLDEQLCESFASTMAANDWKVCIETVAAALKSTDTAYSLYVLCANTYNWSPDWAIQDFVKNTHGLENKNVVAITIGGGSTIRSQRIFEELIKSRKANLLDSKSFWLWKPNDENRMKEPNTKVANDMVKNWAGQIALKLNNNGSRNKTRLTPACPVY